jgi:hypothetical protein
MRFAFRIGDHFGFSDGADKDLATTQIRCVDRRAAPLSRRPVHALHKTLHQPLLARRADLLPNYLSQRLIDPVLPVQSGFLKVIKNVPGWILDCRSDQAAAFFGSVAHTERSHAIQSDTK